MEGKLGGLFTDGNQIGGFLDWKFELLLADSSNGESMVYKFAKWKLDAPAYWIFVEPDNIVVRLYQGNTYWEGEGTIISKIQSVFDALIHEHIEIIGEGILNEHRSDSLPPA